MSRARRLPSIALAILSLTLVAARCGDTASGPSVDVTNSTDRTLGLYWVMGERNRPANSIGPRGSQALVLPPGNRTSDRPTECTEMGLEARTRAGMVVDRLGGPVCLGTQWTIASSS